MTKKQNRDHVLTTVYIFTELMGTPSFISNIDKAMDIAEAFIKIYPHDTDWDNEDVTNWEDTLYYFYNSYEG